MPTTKGSLVILGDGGMDTMIDLYCDQEAGLADVLQLVRYKPENANTEITALSSVIVECGSLVDTLLRKMTPPEPGAKRDIRVFAPYLESSYHLASVRTLLYERPLQMLRPFEGWVDPTSAKFVRPKWWSAYNRLKHERIDHAGLSTLENAVLTACAVHQVMSRVAAFWRPLHRRGMLTTGHYSFSYFSRNARRITALVESRLFATPAGSGVFPARPVEISDAHVFGASRRLSRVLGLD